MTQVSGTHTRLAAPALGRAWRIHTELLAETLEWLADPVDSVPELAKELESVGVLVADQSTGQHERPWGPVRRFHSWTQHDFYQDGADHGGNVRSQVLDRFGEDELRLLRNPTQHPVGDLIALTPRLATVVEKATFRLRANRVRVRAAQHLSEILFSYGAAHDLIVAEEQEHSSRTAWVDLEQPHSGCSIRTDTRDVLHAVNGGDVPCAAIFVIGDFEHYQRRYRHELALRGFFVDGGRLLGEVGRIAAATAISSVHDDLPQNDFANLLGLESRHHLVGAVSLYREAVTFDQMKG